MASRDDDDDDRERFQEKPRPPKATPGRDQGIRPPKPRAALAPRDDDDDDDDRDERRRGSRPPRRRDAYDDSGGTIIPYRNGMALAGYYLGVFSLIPALGALLGVLAIIFGIVGLRRVGRNPEVKGTGHAVTAIVLGGIGALYNWGIVILFFIGVLARGR
jgi:hypothetical protein